MTIDEAIKIKQRTGDEFLATDPDDIDEAERLSIEALKIRKNFIDTYGYDNYILLPGETRD